MSPIERICCNWNSDNEKARVLSWDNIRIFGPAPEEECTELGMQR